MFMRTISAAALLCAAIVPPTIAMAAPVPVTPTGVCSKLAAQYDLAEKDLALTFAEGVGDDSAPRETNRQMENSNYIATAGIAVTLMQAHHCAVPDHAPSAARYMSPALTCATDRIKSGSDAPSCKIDTWEPSKE